MRLIDLAVAIGMDAESCKKFKYVIQEEIGKITMNLTLVRNC